VYPTDEQKRVLAHTFGCVRFVYNWALRLRQQAYLTEQKSVNYGETSAMLTQLIQQPDYSWLNEVSCVPPQQALRHLTLAKMDRALVIRWSRPLPQGCKPSTVTVTKDTANRYFVSILVEEEIKPLPAVSKMVGLDLGLASMVVLSTGESISNPRYFAKDEQKLAKAQRRLAKKKRGSKNRAQAITDVGWGEFVRQLDYKASWYGRTLVKIDRWYPSSKTCSACHHVLETLSLDERFWTCPACGTFHDRDVNAAINVLAEGLSAAASGEAVRPGRANARTGKPR
jgi:putative transposase